MAINWYIRQNMWVINLWKFTTYYKASWVSSALWMFMRAHVSVAKDGLMAESSSHECCISSIISFVCSSSSCSGSAGLNPFSATSMAICFQNKIIATKMKIIHFIPTTNNDQLFFFPNPSKRKENWIWNIIYIIWNLKVIKLQTFYVQRAYLRRTILSFNVWMFAGNKLIEYDAETIHITFFIIRFWTNYFGSHINISSYKDKDFKCQTKEILT